MAALNALQSRVPVPDIVWPTVALDAMNAPIKTTTDNNSGLEEAVSVMSRRRR